MKYNPVIINGFDRSGTSAISKILSSHEDVELIMQPFNSGIIRENMYKPFNEPDTNEAYKFLEGLLNQDIKEEYIHSHWHFNHSTVKEFHQDKLHLIKTTINHFAQLWVKKKFPTIDVWGIWRKPENIISSIFANDFYGKWYSNAIEEIAPTVKNEPILCNFYKYIALLDSDVKRAAFLLTVRSYYFLYHLDSDKLLDFELFKDDTTYLKKFTSYYSLQVHNTKDISNLDLNIIGEKRIKSRIDFNEDDSAFMEEIFSSLIILKNEKFNDKVS